MSSLSRRFDQVALRRLWLNRALEHQKGFMFFDWQFF